jgi:hypothetical protein
MLGPDRVELKPEEVASLIRHWGWSLQFDSPCQLVWPVFPYSPYADAPKTSRGFAVGGATVPIRPQEVDRRLRKQDIRFVLEAAE